MRVPWLPEVLRAAGLDVVEVDGWRGRGRELAGVAGVVIHDTVTTRSWSDDSVAKLLRDGRPDLVGPLSQLGLDRWGRVWIIADGKANHNGYGLWGNNSIGIEVFCAGGLAGKEEPQSTVQQTAGQVATAAILRRIGADESHCQGHREQDPKRKIDPYQVDMLGYRREVAALLTLAADQPTYQEEEPMLIQMEGSPTTVLVVPGVGPRSVHDWRMDVDGLKAKGIPHIVVSKALFARIVRGHDIFAT